MMLVDTSVWVDFFREADTPQSRRLIAALEEHEPVCICGLILTEILQGISSRMRRREVRAALDRLFYLPTVRESYCLAAELYQRARRGGRGLRSAVDCIIAACALDHQVAILHRNRDYDVIAGVSKLKVVRV